MRVVVLGLMATLILQPVTAQADVAVVDIRTPAEWRETGVLEGAHLLTFFDERGGHDARAFVDRLRREVDPSQPLVLVCRSGNRTTHVQNFLRQIGYDRVTHVDGGMTRLIAEGVPTVAPPPDAFALQTEFGTLWRCAADAEAPTATCFAEP